MHVRWFGIHVKKQKCFFKAKSMTVHSTQRTGVLISNNSMSSSATHFPWRRIHGWINSNHSRSTYVSSARKYGIAGIQILRPHCKKSTDMQNNIKAVWMQWYIHYHLGRFPTGLRRYCQLYWRLSLMAGDDILILVTLCKNSYSQDLHYHHHRINTDHVINHAIRIVVHSLRVWLNGAWTNT